MVCVTRYMIPNSNRRLMLSNEHSFNYKLRDSKKTEISLGIGLHPDPSMLKVTIGKMLSLIFYIFDSN